MIRSFRSEGLEELFRTGRSGRINAALHRRILVRLDVLDVAAKPSEMHLPGFDFHGLQGFDPPRFTVHVNGPWCITFAFVGADAVDVDLEQYH